jgi:ferredoxin
LGAIIAGRDLAAVDTLACHLIGLDPSAVPILTAARRRGLGATSLADLEVVGDDWRGLRQPGFEKVSRVEDLLRLVPLPHGVLRWIREQWTLRPAILHDRCTECGVCEEGCPVAPSAIHPGEPAGRQIDHLACIRCYCCHEFCPNQAINLERSGVRRWLEPLATVTTRRKR